MNQLDPQLKLSYEQLKYIKHAHCPKGYVMIERLFAQLGNIEHCIPSTDIENWVRAGWKLSDTNNGGETQPASYSLAEVKRIVSAHQALTNLEKRYHLHIYTPIACDETYFIGVFQKDKTDGDMVVGVKRPTLVEAIFAIQEVLNP